MKAYIACAALALVLAGCGDKTGGNSAADGQASAPLTRIAAPNGGDWAETVAATPEGGFRMGNPAAPVKLVEYASFTCPHCAEFAAEGSEKLRNDYVKSGRVSWEYRPFILFPSDPGIAMLMRCHGPGAFFQLADQIYADQANWVGRLQALPPEAQQQLQAMTPQERAGAFVRGAGLDQFFRVRGMPEARIAACLADPQALQDLAAITDRATNQEGVTGTPTFFINGRKVENAAAWSELEPSLRAAAR
jgi:protein-disulfide isomerase